MNGPQAIAEALKGSQSVLGMFVSDLTDADILVRPAPNANHIAWQLGHLIVAESRLMAEALPEVKHPTLPPGFAELHMGDGKSQENPANFLTKDQYLDLFNRSRAATIEAVGKLREADLDAPYNGRMKKMAPTIGALLLLQSNHTMMHAGQFSVTRRKLGKPVLF